MDINITFVGSDSIYMYKIQKNSSFTFTLITIFFYDETFERLNVKFVILIAIKRRNYT